MKRPICIMAGGTGGNFPRVGVAEELISVVKRSIGLVQNMVLRDNWSPKNKYPFITSWFADFAENMDFSELQVQYDLAFR